jgi:hypothetical protein
LGTTIHQDGGCQKLSPWCVFILVAILNLFPTAPGQLSLMFKCKEIFGMWRFLM